MSMKARQELFDTFKKYGTVLAVGK